MDPMLPTLTLPPVVAACQTVGVLGSLFGIVACCIEAVRR